VSEPHSLDRLQRVGNCLPDRKSECRLPVYSGHANNRRTTLLAIREFRRLRSEGASAFIGLLTACYGFGALLNMLIIWWCLFLPK